MLTVKGDPVSGNGLKVRWTAERLGLPFRWAGTWVLRVEAGSSL